MSKLVIMLTVAISLLAAPPTFSAPSEFHQVRHSFGGKENTPDHLMFDFLLRAMSLRYEADEEFALSIVQESMKLESRESSQDLLDRMLAAGEDLKRTKLALDTAMLCQDNTTRTRASIYQAMDSLDDVKRTIAENAYDDFLRSLDEDEIQNFRNWIDESKEGYSCTAFDHQSLFENRGTDVKIHLQQLCIKKAQEAAAGGDQ